MLDYKSPIEVIFQELAVEYDKQLEDVIMRAVQSVGVQVNREELLKALRYDRNQYEAGFAAGLTAAKVKARWYRRTPGEPAEFCSNCLKRTKSSWDNFCPNCGAEIDPFESELLDNLNTIIGNLNLKEE